MRFECMRTVFSEITSSSAMRTTVLPRTICFVTSASRAQSKLRARKGGDRLTVHAFVLLRHVLEHGLVEIDLAALQRYRQREKRHDDQRDKVHGDGAGDEMQREVQHRGVRGSQDEVVIARIGILTGEQSLPQHVESGRSHTDEPTARNDERHHPCVQVHGADEAEPSQQIWHGRHLAGGCEADDLVWEYRRLFVGPAPKPASPWGSVYTDRECVVFGTSTLALRAWMHGRGIARLVDDKTPEDHIGLMLSLMTWIARNQPDDLDEFLQVHLLTWSLHSLDQLIEAAAHPFYESLARLAKATLEGVQQVRGRGVSTASVLVFAGLFVMWFAFYMMPMTYGISL